MSGRWKRGATNDKIHAGFADHGGYLAIKTLLLTFTALALSASGAAAQYDAAGAAIMGVEAAQGQRSEEACQAGRPPNPDIAADLDRRSEARLAQYFERIGGDDRGSIPHLFIDSGRMARWTGPTGTQPVKAIADPVGAQRAKGTLTRKFFVVSNDMQSARGVWVLTIPNPDDPSKTQAYEYGVDFRLGTFGGMWIWHMHLYSAPDTAPLPPDKFCHIDPAASY